MDQDHIESDEAFAALRAADPTRLSLDIEDMRAMVDTGHHVHRATSGRLTAAAVAAVVALAVGATGGYQIAAQRTSEARDTTSQAAAPVGAAEPGDASITASEADQMAMPVGGRVILQPGSQLTDAASPQVGYLLSGSVDRKAVMRRLAEAFTLGEATAQSDGSLTAGDPNSASASVGSDAAASWWYADNANSPWGCAASSKQSTCAPIAGTPLSDDAAIAAAKELFATLGLADDEATWVVADASWFGTGPDNNPIPFRHVSAELQLGGMSTGLSWTADLGPDGSVSSATGFFAEFAPTKEYATVGARTAALRSQDPRWAAYGPIERQAPGTIIPQASSSAGDATVPTDGEARYDASGRPLLIDTAARITVTSAEPALATYYLADGTTALLPAWDLSDGTRTWAQIAIADKYLVDAR